MQKLPATRLRYTFLLTLLLTGAVLSCLQAQPKPGELPVTAHAKGIKLKDFFLIVWEQTQLQAFYNNEQLDYDEIIDVDFEKEPLDNVLASLLRKKGLTWEYRAETFIITIKKPGEPDLGQLPRGTLSDVRGLVTNKNGAAIKDATVTVRGSNRGTQSGEDGSFSLKGFDRRSTLLISCIGYSPKDLRLKNADTLRVTLEEATTGLDEVVVIAYGTTTRRNLTGAISRVTAADIAQSPAGNPLLAMQGRIPGLDITQLSGLPGGEVKVALRGRNSITAGNSPLYIVDGVPLPSTALTFNNAQKDPSIGPLGVSNPLNMLNSSDIESIEVLKDADATSIYGSRGANGVVLITTKKGEPGKMKLEATLYAGTGKIGHHGQFLNTEQYLQMRQEAFSNDHTGPHDIDYDVRTWDKTRYTNWEKQALGGTAHIKDGQMAISGGSATTAFRFSGGYRRETTVYPDDFSYQKAAARAYYSLSTPDRKVRAVLTTSYVSERNKLPPTDLAALAILPPNTPRLYQDNGKLNWEEGSFDNPMGQLLRPYKATTRNLMVTSVLSYEIWPGLLLKTSAGFNNIQTDEKQVNPWSSFNPAAGYGSTAGGFTYFANGSMENWIVEPQAGYEGKLAGGALNVLIGTTFQQETKDQIGFYGSYFSSDDQLERIDAASKLDQLGGFNYMYRYSALFGRINYNYQGKYILNLTGRRDGSSRFGSGRQFASFGSIGAAWIFSRERWAESLLPFLSFGKLRASYGSTGNDQVADYGYNSTYFYILPYDNQRGRLPARLSNPTYGWEVSKKLEAGLELGLARDKIIFRASYYHNRSSNQLVNYSVPAITGFSSILSNFPAIVQNTGVELELSTVTLTRGAISWNSSFNLSFPRNKLISFPGIETTTYHNYLTVGQPLDIIKGLHYLEVNPATGRYMFTGVDTLGKLAADALTSTRRTGTLFYGGLHNTWQYKGWQLNLLVQFVGQNRYNHLYGVEAPGIVQANQPVEVLNRWQAPGDRTNIQQFTQNIGPAYQAFVNIQRSDAVITDASFIRLKSLSLGYQLPTRWMERAHLQSARVFLQGQNLLTLTGYKGRDPEVAVNHNVYPPLRLWTLGLHLSL